MLIRLVLLAVLLVDGLLTLIFALNVEGLWAILLVSGGILIGLLTIRGDGRTAGWLCSLGLAAVPAYLAVRASPIHSFDWGPIRRLDRVEIAPPPDRVPIAITDPKALREFESLVGTGYYQTGSKCGDCFGVALCDGPNRSNYVIRYDCFGRWGGAHTETVFVPRRREDFRRWLERALNKQADKKNGTDRL
jgi:hypothetical protein